MVSFMLPRLAGELARGYLRGRRGGAPGASIAIDFRCWPLGQNLLGHMSNVDFLAIAELARWNAKRRRGNLQ